MDRREFIKNVCGLCILSSSALLVGSLGSCSSAVVNVVTADNNNRLKLDLSTFQTNQTQIIRTTAWDYDLAVNKKDDGTFEVLSLRCTHADENLQITNKGYICNLHGSFFNKDGTVLRGPASKQLQKLKTFVENNTVVIQL